mmetsp:Transcript_94/g.155  ORF Transcript_94/g.155 Transcript_94/m.155 type:complete len:203 (-) Transcript_94:280-888(-)|eukprot:CAMPEP_0113646832 /NCGR_PEP_ID=MMETSP0017_2-20120614/24757_1 /TAXON_ID=2856 /ORGANISM="Cylindrotheca closterium" /LENGTH=202 /DNA_ID=CAMNT_0000558787 /DNA_START=108 /DNA_END=716 /DNA_ORIENTATION=+ /assembly_acc=CAM_ASM_000147
MVLKTFYKRIRKSIPRFGATKKQSTFSTKGKKQTRHAKKQNAHIRDDLLQLNRSPQEELREEYQELIRTSYRMVRCLGDDLESSIDGSSCVSGYRYRDQAWADNHNKGIPRTTNYVQQRQQPIEVTHLLDDSDDEAFGLHFANMAAAAEEQEEEESKDDTESRESASVFINIDECRDTDLCASPKREEDREIYYRTSNRGYF